jgi:hypothetical protein
MLPKSLLQSFLTFQIMQDGAWEWDLVCNVMTCMTAYSDAIFLGKIIVLMTIKKFCLAKKKCLFTFPTCKVTYIFFPIKKWVRNTIMFLYRFWSKYWDVHPGCGSYGEESEGCRCWICKSCLHEVKCFYSLRFHKVP